MPESITAQVTVTKGDASGGIAVVRSTLDQAVPVGPPLPSFTIRVNFGSGGITLPLMNGETYDFMVNWGDGSSVGHVTAWDDAAASHTYADDAIYKIVIVGAMPQWNCFTNGLAFQPNILSVDDWGPIQWDSLGAFMYHCSNATSIAGGGVFGGVFDASGAFNACTSLVTIGDMLLPSVPMNLANFVFGCSALEKFLIRGIVSDLSLAGCNMNAAALNVAFNNLGTVVGKTIDVTGNPGEPTCDKIIAQLKGWTVIP